jgi:Ca2+-binding RTX toxin-like protein
MPPRRASPVHATSTTFPLQPLDRRVLLAATAVLDAGLLTVTGDAAANEIDVVFDDAANEIVVTLDGATPQRFAVPTVEDVLVQAGDGNDQVSVNVFGAVAVPTVRGEGGDDTIVGSEGTDSIDGGSGDDSLLGGGAGDTLNGDGGEDTLVGDHGDDVLNGGGEDDLLDGGFDWDTINGGAGDDTLLGLGGNDDLDGGTGADEIDGGSGHDRATYATRAAGLDLSLDGAANDGEAGENDNLLFVEHLTGGLGNDTLTGDGRGNYLDGGSGGHAFIFGQGGNDTIIGGRLADSLDGGSGNDRFNAHGGGDTLFGQGGDDTLMGDSGNDHLDGGSGHDFLFGGKQADVCLGQGGDDAFEALDLMIFQGLTMLPADAAPDTLSGGSGLDTLSYSYAARGHFLPAGVTITFDGVANDGMAGEKDSVASDFEIIEATQHDDVIDVSGMPGRRRIHAWTGDDTIIGSAGADTVIADQGDDSITGNNAEDRLLGGAGNDTFLTDDGFADVVRGGEGADSADVDAGDALFDVETTT